jgi:hypothetical protein
MMAGGDRDMNHKKNNFWSKVGATLAAMAIILILFAATPLKASAAEAKREPGKISGFMFGDYYFASRHHNSAIEGMNGTKGSRSDSVWKRTAWTALTRQRATP